MTRSRFDIRTFLMIFGAALLGAGWAIYNRRLTDFPYAESEFPRLVWIIFATPFATFWGWFFARRQERWWAALICFCMYFFSPFIAARYESCTVLSGTFNLVDCFTATSEAQVAAESNGHQIYFATIVVVHLLVALGLALHRALSRSTIPKPPPFSEGEPAPAPEPFKAVP